MPLIPEDLEIHDKKERAVIQARRKLAEEHDDPEGGVKSCSQCLNTYPATKEYFYSDSTKPDGLRDNCKACHEENKRKYADKQIAERMKMMDRASMMLLENLVGGGSDIPHLAELYQRVLEAFDGVGGFAQHYMANYLMAKPGSATREKMLRTVIQMGTRLTEQGATTTPVDLMSDEDLELELQKRAKRVLRITYNDDGTDTDAAKVS